MRTLHIEVYRNNKDLFQYDVEQRVESALLHWEKFHWTLLDYKTTITENKNKNDKRKFVMMLEIYLLDINEDSPKENFFKKFLRKRRIKNMNTKLVKKPVSEKLKEMIRKDNSM